MPNNYNPNEIVKLKHLNEFARQLSIKLDGGTDPKTQRVISSITSSSGATVEKVDGVYKIEIQASAITGNPKAVNVIINSVQLSTFPIYVPKVLNLQIQGGFAFYSFRMEKLSISKLATYFTQNNQPVAGETIKGTIVIPEDENYAELAVPFEIYIV